jgi:hypothetical protein
VSREAVSNSTAGTECSKGDPNDIAVNLKVHFALESCDIMSQDSDSTPALRPSHLAPARQPNHVRDIAARLLSAYNVEGGSVHIAGCTLDDVPVVRISCSTSTDEPFVAHVIFGQANEQGKLVDPELSSTLELANLVPAERPTSIPPREVDRLVTAAIECARKSLQTPSARPNAVALIWCKYARIKIQFTAGAATAQTSFAGWASAIEPAPFHCAISATETFSVASSSDNRIVAADQLGVCQQTGQRLPSCELVESAVSGQLVSATLTTRCPVIGESILLAEMATCPSCRQSVSPNAITASRCRACRTASPIQKDDTRLIKILARHPSVAQWNWFRLTETEQVFVLVASGFFHRRLLVFDKENVAVLHVAKGNRLSTEWPQLDVEEL